MTHKIPKTAFSTALSGSAKATKERIRNIFRRSKRRPPVLAVILVASCILLCGSLVSCQTQISKPDAPITVVLTSQPEQSISANYYADMSLREHNKLPTLTTYGEYDSLVIELPKGLTQEVRITTEQTFDTTTYTNGMADFQQNGPKIILPIESKGNTSPETLICGLSWDGQDEGFYLFQVNFLNLSVDDLNLEGLAEHIQATPVGTWGQLTEFQVEVDSEIYWATVPCKNTPPLEGTHNIVLEAEPYIGPNDSSTGLYLQSNFYPQGVSFDCQELGWLSVELTIDQETGVVSPDLSTLYVQLTAPIPFPSHSS